MAQQEWVERQVEEVVAPGSGIYAGSSAFDAEEALAEMSATEEREVRRSPVSTLEKALLLAGRVTFGGYFVYNGINHFLHRKMMAEYARSKGVPAPELAVVGSGCLILAGGLSVITGAVPKLGAGLIATFLLGVSPQMHAFWREQDPQQRMGEMVNFTKNMALIGASLLAAAHPDPWPWSVGPNTTLCS